MLFDWSDYYRLACTLCGRSSDRDASEEAKSRAAISRAYYAAFCSARNFLRDVERESTSPDPHTLVPKKLMAKKGVSVTIGNQLLKLKYLRNDADYEDSYPDNSSYLLERDRALRLAQKILKALEAMSRGKSNSSSRG